MVINRHLQHLHLVILLCKKLWTGLSQRSHLHNNLFLLQRFNQLTSLETTHFHSKSLLKYLRQSPHLGLGTAHHFQRTWRDSSLTSNKIRKRNRSLNLTSLVSCRRLHQNLCSIMLYPPNLTNLLLRFRSPKTRNPKELPALLVASIHRILTLVQAKILPTILYSCHLIKSKLKCLWAILCRLTRLETTTNNSPRIANKPIWFSSMKKKKRHKESKLRKKMH